LKIVLNTINLAPLISFCTRGRSGRDHMVVGVTTTYIIGCIF